MVVVLFQVFYLLFVFLEGLVFVWSGLSGNMLFQHSAKQRDLPIFPPNRQRETVSLSEPGLLPSR